MDSTELNIPSLWVLTLRTLMPVVISPRECLFLSSVTVAIGFSPAFSARVIGITSNAEANALQTILIMFIGMLQYGAFKITVCEATVGLALNKHHFCFFTFILAMDEFIQIENYCKYLKL